MECCIYRGSDSREDDRCLVPPRARPSHPALGSIATVGDVGQCSAGLPSNLDKDKWRRSALGVKMYNFSSVILYTVYNLFLVDSPNHILIMCRG